MIKFSADHYFHIGHAHLAGGKPCQDYTLSTLFGKTVLAVVSDGCSTGGKTDVGARILALSTARAVEMHKRNRHQPWGVHAIQEIAFWQNSILLEAQKMFGLELNDMFATCLYAYISPLGGYIHIHGDGVVAVKYLDGHIALSRFEWNQNTPFYPAYTGEVLDGFIKIHSANPDENSLSEEMCEYYENEYTDCGVVPYSIAEGIKGIKLVVSLKQLQEIEFIALFSDGVTQIDGVDWKDAVVEFLSFKNVVGSFAKRRMIRGIKDFQKSGKGPMDDISYSVIHVETIEDEEEADGED